MSYVTNQSQIIRVEITPAMRARIEAKSSERGVLNSRTIVRKDGAGEGNFAGFAGEEIVRAFLPMLTPDTASRDWDFLSPTGITIDVKSKGNNVGAPKINFDCTVPKYQVEAQKCTIYVFTRIAANKSCGWINGWVTKVAFQKEAEYRAKGERYNNVGRPTVEDVLVLPIHRLATVQSMKDYFIAKAKVA